MSVGSVGVEGYPDDQTLGNLDDVALLNLAGVTYTGNQNFPAAPADVSRYQALAGFASVALASVGLVFNYYLYPSAANFLGSRALVLDPNIQQAALFHIPNLGPYVQANYVAPTNLTQFEPTLIAYPTNRIGGLDLPAPGDVLQSWSSISIGPGLTLTRWFLQYYAGPARLWISADAAGCTWALNCQQRSGVVEVVDQGAVGVGVVSSVPVLIPARACQLVVTNTGAGSAHVSGMVVCSMTGAL